MADVSQAAADHFHDADLFCPFIDRHHHRIRYADGRHQKRHGADAAQHRLDHEQRFLHAFDQFHICVYRIAHVPDDLSKVIYMVHVVGPEDN